MYTDFNYLIPSENDKHVVDRVRRSSVTSLSTKSFEDDVNERAAAVRRKIAFKHLSHIRIQGSCK